MDKTALRLPLKLGRVSVDDLIDSKVFFRSMTSLTLILVILFSLSRLTAPQPAFQSAPATEFSAGRALPHIEAIAQKPHPLGSPEQAQARDYLVQRLTDLGLQAQVQETVTSNQRQLLSLFEGNIYLAAGNVQNVVARLPGTDSTQAILLMAHYDSVPNGAGASDNGVGVAALLETARALTASGPLKNDVIFLFTDGEEEGLLGAHGFVKEHPWAKDVGLVFNFEARGNTGPTLMFETSTNNGWLIKEFARASVPQPLVSSLFYEVYKALPNDTDFTVFKEAGIAGANFAFLEGFTHYHTAIDSIENVDLGSLQHHGVYALSLARHYGNLDLRNIREGDQVYFSLLGSVIVLYPYWLALPLAILLGVLFIAAVGLGLRQGGVTWRGLLAGSGVFVLTLVLNVILATLLWRAVTFIHPNYLSIRQGDLYNSAVYRAGFVLLSVAMTSLLYVWFYKKVNVQNLTLGGLIWWLVLAVASSVYFPGASYLFVWPLLFILLGILTVFARKKQDFTQPRVAGILCLSVVPGLIVLAPVINLLFVALTISSADLVSVVVGLTLVLLIPYFIFISDWRKYLLPVCSALIGLAFLVAGSWTSGFNHSQPKQNSMVYGLIADHNTAIWASTDHRPDQWTAQFFAGGYQAGPMPEFFPLVRTEFIKGEAPVLPLAAPDVTVLEQQVADDVRVVRIHVSSPRLAPAINIYIDAQTYILGARVDGKRVYQNGDPITHTAQWGLRYWTLPASGFNLDLEIPAADPLKLVVVDQSPGLPVMPGVSYTPRPDSVIASPFGFEGNEFTRVSKTFVLIK